jgi:hypothetical protein
MTPPPDNTPPQSLLAPMPVGQLALRESLNLAVPLLATRSYIVSGARQTRESDGVVDQLYPRHYTPENTPREHLRFALKYEPLDLGLLHTAFQKLGGGIILDWVHNEPTGQYSRRAWFLYEVLTGDVLDLPPVKSGNYVDALDERHQYTLQGIDQPRYRVRDNRICGGGINITLRRSTKLASWESQALSEEARKITDGYAPGTLARAVSFLYTRETRSSFAIEGETPSASREERIFQALQGLPRFQATRPDLLSLQGQIVEPRYAASDWRDIQNFVGETTRGFGEFVHFICPKPEDVPSLMTDWEALTARLLSSSLDPVLSATACAFPFVFIHPFEDGNGRVHRFLILHLLERLGFSQPGVVLPVSAAILRSQSEYEKVLERISRPLLGLMEWRQDGDGGVIVESATRDLYRFFDLTAQAEFLYTQVAEAIRVDFKEELAFLSVFDAALSGVRSVVDMPDRRASLLVRLCLQNGGRLSKSKRGQFVELSDLEIEQMEALIQGAMAAVTKEQES